MYVNAKSEVSHPSRIDGNCEHISKLHQKSTSCRQELEYPGPFSDGAMHQHAN